MIFDHILWANEFNKRKKNNLIIQIRWHGDNCFGWNTLNIRKLCNLISTWLRLVSVKYSELMQKELHERNWNFRRLLKRLTFDWMRKKLVPFTSTRNRLIEATDCSFLSRMHNAKLVYIRWVDAYVLTFDYIDRMRIYYVVESFACLIWTFSLFIKCNRVSVFCLGLQ